MHDIGVQNFPWMNYTFYKVSSQVDLTINNLQSINCTAEECKAIDIE